VDERYRNGGGTLSDAGLRFIMLTGGGVLDLGSSARARASNGLGNAGATSTLVPLSAFLGPVSLKFKVRSRAVVRLIVLLVEVDSVDKVVS